jgi:REP element-mobilizing transposase RayT
MLYGYKIRDQSLPHFITATVVDWVDVFTRKSYRDIVIECMNYCITNKAMILYGYVIMSNHMHMSAVGRRRIVKFDARFQKIYCNKNYRDNKI